MKKLYDIDPVDTGVFFEETKEPSVEATAVDVVLPETEEELPNTPVELTENDQEQLNKLYESIKGKASSPIKTTRPRFTRGKGDVSFNIDGTKIEPKKSTMVGKGTFEERYATQLNGFIYSNSDRLDPDDLIPLLILIEMSEKGKRVIRITTGKYKLIAGKMVNVLNTFFEDNAPILEAMFKMFSDIGSVPPPDEKEVKDDQR